MDLVEHKTTLQKLIGKGKIDETILSFNKFHGPPLRQRKPDDVVFRFGVVTDFLHKSSIELSLGVAERNLFYSYVVNRVFGSISKKGNAWL